MVKQFCVAAAFAIALLAGCGSASTPRDDPAEVSVPPAIGPPVEATGDSSAPESSATPTPATPTPATLTPVPLTPVPLTPVPLLRTPIAHPTPASG